MKSSSDIFNSERPTRRELAVKAAQERDAARRKVVTPAVLARAEALYEASPSRRSGAVPAWDLRGVVEQGKWIVKALKEAKS